MHILVTGGSGFLGRHVVAQALGRGYAVTSWSRRPGRAGGEAAAAVTAAARPVAVDLADAARAYIRSVEGAETGKIFRLPA